MTWRSRRQEWRTKQQVSLNGTTTAGFETQGHWRKEGHRCCYWRKECSDHWVLIRDLWHESLRNWKWMPFHSFSNEEIVPKLTPWRLNICLAINLDFDNALQWPLFCSIIWLSKETRRSKKKKVTMFLASIVCVLRQPMGHLRLCVDAGAGKAVLSPNQVCQVRRECALWLTSCPSSINISYCYLDRCGNWSS